MSLSDFSDLTDLSSDEDDVPLSQKTYKKAAPAKKTAKEYKISNVLRPPRTTQYTAKSLYDQIIDNSIDLDPEYQRDVVWAESKQSGLIDSILRNYYMPPIIFAVSIADDGSELRTCIDGKQRLTSIQRFIDGQIPHKDSFTNEKLWFKAGAPKQRRKLLPKNLMTQFANKQVVCVEYHDLNEDQEREIFQRVQLGVALTPAERMQAIVGPWPSLIREIQSQVLGENGFQGYLDWGHARGRDFQCLASIVYLIDNLPKQSFPGAPQLEKWIQRTDSVPAKLKAELTDTFRIFVTLARDTKYSGSLHKPTRVSPIEFVMIGVLIYLQRSALSLTQLSSAVEKMRADVRAKHVDIRANTRITKDMMGFITKKIKISQLRNDGDDKPAANKLSKRTASKRKRSAAESSDVSDGSEDESSKPPTRKATNPKPVKSTPSTTSTSKTDTKAQSSSKQSASQKKVPASKPSQAVLSPPSSSAVKPLPQTGRPTIKPPKSSASSPSSPTIPSRPSETPRALLPLTSTPTPRLSPPNGSIPRHRDTAPFVASQVQNPPFQLASSARLALLTGSGSAPLLENTAPVSAVTDAVPPCSSVIAIKEISRTPTPSYLQSLNSPALTQPAHDPRRPPSQTPPTIATGQELSRASIEAILRAAGIKSDQSLPSPVASASSVSGPSSTMTNVNAPFHFNTPPMPGTIPGFVQGLNNMQVSSSPQSATAVMANELKNLYLSSPSSLPQVLQSSTQPEGTSFPYVNNLLPNPGLPPRPTQALPPTPETATRFTFANNFQSNHGLPSRPTQALPPTQADQFHATPAGGPIHTPPPQSASSAGSIHEERRNSDYDRREREYRRSSAPYDKSRDRDRDRGRNWRSTHHDRDRPRGRSRDRERDGYSRRDSSNRERDRPRDSGWASRGRNDGYRK